VENDSLKNKAERALVAVALSTATLAMCLSLLVFTR
jgi:hypothetical protein